MTGWVVALAVLALVVAAVAVGLALRRPVRPRLVAVPAAPASTDGLPPGLAAPAGGLVLLQLSSAFCASCRDTRSVLADVASEVPGVVHRDVDIAVRPELVRLLDVRDTPTTLLVDAAGVELLRIAGVPRRAALLSALAPHRPDRPSASA